MTTESKTFVAISQREHQLQCMEIWKGNRFVEQNVRSAASKPGSLAIRTREIDRAEISITYPYVLEGSSRG